MTDLSVGDERVVNFNTVHILNDDACLTTQFSEALGF